MQVKIVVLHKVIVGHGVKCTWGMSDYMQQFRDGVGLG